MGLTQVDRIRRKFENRTRKKFLGDTTWACPNCHSAISFSYDTCPCGYSRENDRIREAKQREKVRAAARESETGSNGRERKSISRNGRADAKFAKVGDGSKKEKEVVIVIDEDADGVEGGTGGEESTGEGEETGTEGT